MSESILPASIHLGFMTVFAEANGYLGGYLVTNTWGRPLEFRLSTAVQPNKVQQILYGATLQEYLCAELIGKTLIEKTSTPIHLLFTDSLLMQPIRSRLEIPVVTTLPDDQSETPLVVDRPLIRLTDVKSAVPLVFEERFAADSDRIRAILERIDNGFDVSEPFSRIREAMGEARKMGVTSRAA